MTDVDDGEEAVQKVRITNDRGSSRSSRKRKRRAASPENVTAGEREARLEALEEELDGLFAFHREVKCQKVCVELSDCGSRDAAIAVLMEESELPLSALVEDIFEKLRSGGSGTAVKPASRASVKSSVVSIGQRIAYGVPNAEADVLEDDSESCFWCWEARDVKMIPRSVRGQFIVRRICRRRIHERIVAVSEVISSLKKPKSEQSYNHGLIKASAMLCKVYKEADIRLLVHGLMQKTSVDMDLKKAKREEKLLLKQLDRNTREVKIGKENMQSELQAEIFPSEKDSKMLRGDSSEASKDDKCHAKDVCENKKQKKKQPGESERDRRRREKEESEIKKKNSLQKQASIMECFLKRSKPSNSFQNVQLSSKSVVSHSATKKIENACDYSATLSMDCTLASSNETTFEDIRKSHLSMWRGLGKSICMNRKQRWGLRQKPKSELFKELKLASTTRVAHYGDLAMEKDIDRLGEHNYEITLDPTNADSSPLDVKKYCRRKQLLQFDKSPRPAFYGICFKKSKVVGPRHPLRKEPSLDYDVNSEEEWEEEDPGESLSDCDKDEEECVEECSKSDDDDGFFVPDGFLSEDEGAQVDTMETGIDIEGAQNSPSGKDDVESEEFCALLQQQKNLNNFTENALKRNQPLIITNLMHDKELDQNLSGTLKLEQMCLQSLSMRVISASSFVEISMDHFQDKEQYAYLSTGKGRAALVSDIDAMLDSNLPLIVATIQKYPQGIKKVLKSLQQLIPSASKSLLRHKVLEISDYVDKRLQVKKEVLVKLGWAFSPDKGCLRRGSIATFFSRSCLPSSCENVKPGDKKHKKPSNTQLQRMETEHIFREANVGD